MTPQQFIKEVEGKFEHILSNPNLVHYQGETAIIQSFLLSQFSRLLEEVIKSMPEEKERCCVDASCVWHSNIRGFNDCRQSMLTTLKEWKEGVEGKEGNE